jgi:rhodanese-related sulfurtransferase
MHMPTYRQRPYDLLLDVRSKLEFWLGHLPGAVCIAHDRLPEGLAGQPGIAKTSRIVVYCASGARSAAATQALQRAGYTKVTDAGGIEEARPHIT